MKIVVPMAGKSQRFFSCGYTLPKFLLPLPTGLTVIEAVISCFAETDDFHFIISNSQEKKFEITSRLRSLNLKNATYHIIKDNNAGPVASVLSVEGLLDLEPVIISYCDFVVKWDYRRFLQFCQDADMVIPFFSGFHAASIGETFYAYMMLDDIGGVEDLREKRSFTENRIEEPASTGTYYFSSGVLFEQFARELSLPSDGSLKELYVSLLAKPLIESDHSVKGFPVEKFVCLGTPADYEQFKHWFEIHLHKPWKRNANRSSGAEEGTINVIPMVGEGSRFKANHFKTLKPFIGIGSSPMLSYVLENLPDAECVCLSLLEEWRNSYSVPLGRLTSENRQMVSWFTKKTRGQLETLALSCNSIPDNKRIFVASCDYAIGYDHMAWKAIEESTDADVIVWVTKLAATPVKDYRAFGYCQIDVSTDEIVSVVEKNTISSTPADDPMIVGSFWFKNKSLIWNAYENGKKDFNSAREMFIGESLNYLIKQNLVVRPFYVDSWISWGDPLEYELFHFWSEYFEVDY